MGEKLNPYDSPAPGPGGDTRLAVHSIALAFVVGCPAFVLASCYWMPTTEALRPGAWIYLGVSAGGLLIAQCGRWGRLILGMMCVFVGVCVIAAGSEVSARVSGCGYLVLLLIGCAYCAASVVFVTSFRPANVRPVKRSSESFPAENASP